MIRKLIIIFGLSLFISSCSFFYKKNIYGLVERRSGDTIYTEGTSFYTKGNSIVIKQGESVNKIYSLYFYKEAFKLKENDNIRGNRK